MGIEPKTPNKISGYTDPTGGMSNKDLALSGWFVRNKILFRKIGMGALITWIVIGGIYSITVLGAYLFSGFWQDRDIRLQTVQGFENYEALQESYRAQPLLIDSVKIFQNGESYDFVALSQNPNKDFIARIRYKYVFDGGETASKVVSVLPLKRFPLTLYGFESSVFPVGARLVIEDTRWRRTNPHTIADTTGYIHSRLNTPITNLVLESGSLVPQITFDIKNDTAYSYYEGKFALLLLSGNSIEAVIPLSIKNFRAGETFPVDLRPTFTLSGITDVDIIPLMDVFDQNEFLPAASL